MSDLTITLARGCSVSGGGPDVLFISINNLANAKEYIKNKFNSSEILQIPPPEAQLVSPGGGEGLFYFITYS